eukprot:TRINITY_DN11251_c0_g2_i10.p2 TRINITY_DN11251_c0_g2~~TRINITY_DN11251_c0_g2_i10.p2  ORF type:complete len:334 (+),score=46.36 TRINITY_DN11251_c0_g2_i10:2117-3118(+)
MAEATETGEIDRHESVHSYAEVAEEPVVGHSSGKPLRLFQLNEDDDYAQVRYRNESLTDQLQDDEQEERTEAHSYVNVPADVASVTAYVNNELQGEELELYDKLPPASCPVDVELSAAQRAKLLATHGAYSSAFHPSSSLDLPVDKDGYAEVPVRSRASTIATGYKRFRDSAAYATVGGLDSGGISTDGPISPPSATAKTGRVRVASPESTRQIELLAVTRCRSNTSTVMELHPYTQDVVVGERPKLPTPVASRTGDDISENDGRSSREDVPTQARLLGSGADLQGDAALNPAYEGDDDDDYGDNDDCGNDRHDHQVRATRQSRSSQTTCVLQ